LSRWLKRRGIDMNKNITIMITGGPRTGKSFIAHELADLLDKLGCEIVVDDAVADQETWDRHLAAGNRLDLTGKKINICVLPVRDQ